MNLDKIVEAVKWALPWQEGHLGYFPAVCDGISMGHIGMKCSWLQRFDCDSTECMAMAHGLTGW